MSFDMDEIEGDVQPVYLQAAPRNYRGSRNADAIDDVNENQKGGNIDILDMIQASQDAVNEAMDEMLLDPPASMQTQDVGSPVTLSRSISSPISTRGGSEFRNPIITTIESYSSTSQFLDDCRGDRPSLDSVAALPSDKDDSQEWAEVNVSSKLTWGDVNSGEFIYNSPSNQSGLNFEVQRARAMSPSRGLSSSVKAALLDMERRTYKYTQDLGSLPPGGPLKSSKSGGPGVLKSPHSGSTESQNSPGQASRSVVWAESQGLDEEYLRKFREKSDDIMGSSSTGSDYLESLKNLSNLGLGRFDSGSSEDGSGGYNSSFAPRRRTRSASAVNSDDSPSSTSLAKNSKSGHNQKGIPLFSSKSDPVSPLTPTHRKVRIENERRTVGAKRQQKHYTVFLHNK